jgi:hypothetical protein
MIMPNTPELLFFPSSSRDIVEIEMLIIDVVG